MLARGTTEPTTATPGGFSTTITTSPEGELVEKAEGKTGNRKELGGKAGEGEKLRVRNEKTFLGVKRR